MYIRKYHKFKKFHKFLLSSNNKEYIIKKFRINYCILKLHTICNCCICY